MRGWDLQDARGVEVATYADLYGELRMCKALQFTKLDIDANWILIADINRDIRLVNNSWNQSVLYTKRYFNGF